MTKAGGKVPFNAGDSSSIPPSMNPAPFSTMAVATPNDKSTQFRFMNRVENESKIPVKEKRIPKIGALLFRGFQFPKYPPGGWSRVTWLHLQRPRQSPLQGVTEHTLRLQDPPTGFRRPGDPPEDSFSAQVLTSPPSPYLAEFAFSDGTPDGAEAGAIPRWLWIPHAVGLATSGFSLSSTASILIQWQISRYFHLHFNTMYKSLLRSVSAL